MRPNKLLKLSCLSLFLLMALNGCITIKDGEVCSVSDYLTNGAICSTMIGHKTREMNLDEFIYFLEPQEQTDQNEAKAGAMCMSAKDWNELKTKLEQACRMLGKRCKYATQ